MVGGQATPGAPSQIEEDGEFEVETPLSVGRVYAPALDFETARVHIPIAQDVDQETPAQLLKATAKTREPV